MLPLHLYMAARWGVSTPWLARRGRNGNIKWEKTTVHSTWSVNEETGEIDEKKWGIGAYTSLS